MIKRKIITILSILFCQFLFCQQFNDLKIIYEGRLDSVTISTFYTHNKETSTVGDTTADGSVIQLKKRVLTKLEVSNLNKLLKNKKSYSKKVPLLNDYNISFNFFLRDKIIQKIDISLLTKKITIKKEECFTLDKDRNSMNPCLYYASISKNFEKFIMQLASK